METLEVKYQISFKCLFGQKSNSKSIDKLISTLPSKKTIEYVSSMHFLKSNQIIKQTDFELFNNFLFSKINIELKENIECGIQEAKAKDYNFIDNVALLILLEKLLTKHNDNSNELSESDYSNLMQAYLICCDERISLNAVTIDEKMDADSFVRIYLPEKIKYDDIDYKDIRVELIRAYMFMDFCERNDTFKPLFKRYLDRMNISNWKEALFFIIDLNKRLNQNIDKYSCRIKITSDSYMKKYLDIMSVDVNKFEPSSDFTGIREKPVYYQGDNKYNILDINCYIDKLFQSFLFDFANVLTMDKEVKEIKSYPQLRARVGEPFSEKYLFYALMEGCFKQTYDIIISGQELKKYLSGGEPDYYLRKNKNIFLFEFKDVMLSAKIKHCDNFDKIEKELSEQFELSTEEKSAEKKKEKPQDKGITQLLNVIENKLDQIINEIDKVESSEELNIFPVIIFQDYNFDIEGVNYILNNRFKELLKSRNIPEHYIIKDLVMFSLTTLIQLEDLFSKGKLNLEQIIMNYFTSCSHSERNKTTPFYKFILRYAINEKGYNQENTKRYDDIINNIEKIIIKQVP